jgi:SAM-dependent methyltransferase
VPEELATAREQVRQQLLDAESLVRATAGGALRGESPPWRRVELRPVEIKDGPRLQVVTFDARQSFTANHEWGAAAEAAVDELLSEPFGHWHVTTTGGEVSFRVTRAGRVLSSRTRKPRQRETSHDRQKSRVVDPRAPFLKALGVSDAAGHVKKSKADKYRQVEQFVRALDADVRDAQASGRLTRRPLRVVDLGCGNAYLTFAIYHHLHETLGIEVEVVGVDVKEQARRHNTEVAGQLGWGDKVRFFQGEIASVEVDGPVDVAVALHACDTATDDALARAVEWGSALVLAAPCCHHELQRQLRAARAPEPYRLVTRNALLRERMADVFTDSIRAHLLRRSGYRTEVVEFVDSKHTPRNVLLRAHLTGSAPSGDEEREYRQLVDDWRLRPPLERLLVARTGAGTGTPD